ncbi:hypothetical protein HAX54_026731 [Datura stramonium]|uniref:DUS-like FMN-binding domain-containing protein n=1 Tax=Datura stramonium TaxID=4076 RepID=A0ABS8S856_DATST|nr:hypothetical protein [Datura stramonium]
MVAPMVDNSELPFRLLCRKYGAEAAYTPMLHSRLFNEDEKYRSVEFTTCKRIAKRWNYGVMDNLSLVKSLVEKLANNLNVCIMQPNFPNLARYTQLCKDVGGMQAPENHPFSCAQLLGEWFRIQPSVREDLNKQYKLTFEFLYDLVNRLRELGVRIPLYVKDTQEPVSAN